jgi:hypothetical protein
MERHEPLDAWVNGKMASGLPAEWPDDREGWRLLEQRLEPRRRRAWVWAATTAAAVLVAAFALPATRTAAQRLWDEVVIGRIEMLTTDFEHFAVAHLFTPEVRRQPEPSPVASLEEAGDKAGFVPRLPKPGVLSSQPTFSVTDVGLAALPLDGRAIRRLAVRGGISASEVPASWNSGMLEVHIGPIVIADYDGVLLLQSLPFEMKTPADFDRELFYRIAFKSLGMSDHEARAMSMDAAMSPAYLTLAPQEEEELFTKFQAKNGTGVMIAEVYGPGKLVALWSGVDRLYALYPKEREISKEFVIEVANSVD